MCPCHLKSTKKMTLRAPAFHRISIILLAILFGTMILQIMIPLEDQSNDGTEKRAFQEKMDFKSLESSQPKKHNEIYTMYLKGKLIRFNNKGILSDDVNIDQDDTNSPVIISNRTYHLERSYVGSGSHGALIATPSDNDGVDRSKEKSVLVIHAGPNESGAPYLQRLLAKPEAQEILLKDNYIYIGLCPKKSTSEDCFYRTKTLSPFTDASEKNLKPEFEVSFTRMRNERVNGLLVWETAASWIGKLMPYLDDFDVRVITTYRRIFDFLPSFYMQNMKHYKFSKEDKFGPVPFDFFPEHKLENLGLQQYAAYFKMLAYHDGMHKAKERLDVAVSINVTSLGIMDFHAKYDDVVGDDIGVELFCTGAVPGTNHTCEAIKLDTLKGRKIKFGLSMKAEYFVFAHFLYQKGILKRRPNIGIVQRIQSIMSNFDNSRFRKNCMSESSLKELYALSWKHEKIIFPERDEKGHKESFEEFKADGRHCSLNIIDLFRRDEDIRQWITSWEL